MMGARAAILFAMFVTAGVVAAPPARAQMSAGRTIVTIATATPNGNYFLTGNALCRALQRRGHELSSGDINPISCVAMPTAGSINNVDLLRTRTTEAALIQSDWLYHGFNGTDRFAGRPMTQLRTLLTLNDEYFQVVSARGTRIEMWSDLKAKKVNLGPAGSTSFSMFNELLAAHGQTESWFTQALRLPVNAQVQELCEGNIEAFGQTSGLPNGGVRDALARCTAQMAALDTPEVRALTAARPYYKAVAIPADTYPGQRVPIPTIAVTATLVATADMPETLAYSIVRAFIDGLGDIQAGVAALRDVTTDALSSAQLVAPLHPGAERALREAGLYKSPAIVAAPATGSIPSPAATAASPAPTSPVVVPQATTPAPAAPTPSARKQSRPAPIGPRFVPQPRGAATGATTGGLR